MSWGGGIGAAAPQGQFDLRLTEFRANVSSIKGNEDGNR